MEELSLDIIKEISNFSAIGVVALALLFGFYIFKNRKENGKESFNKQQLCDEICQMVTTKIEENDLHEINERLDRMDDKIDKIDEKFESKFNSIWKKTNDISSTVSYMKGKENGKE